MTMKAVLILLVAVAGMSAEDHCCLQADKFEIHLGLIISSDHHVPIAEPERKVIISSEIAVDYDEKRAAEKATIWESGIETHWQAIIDFEKRVLVLISFERSQCGTFYLNSTHMPRCIPEAAKPTGSSYLGDNKITQDSYFYNISTESESAEVFLSVTKDGCIPLSTVAIVHEQNVYGRTVISGGFTGFVNDIKDPASFFQLPDFCHEAVSKNNLKQTMFKHHLNLLFL